jgi:hypothetical protein
MIDMYGMTSSRRLHQVSLRRFCSRQVRKMELRISQLQEQVEACQTVIKEKDSELDEKVSGIH